MTRRYAVRAAALLGLVAVFCTGCSGAGGETRSARPSDSSASPSSEPPAPTKAEIAEKVKNTLEERISADEEKLGSGVESSCSPTSPQLFTTKCQTAADATSDAADLALREIDGRAGFATPARGKSKPPYAGTTPWGARPGPQQRTSAGPALTRPP
ncbi:hypothetical protein SALBM311S_09909 [Streptomyces alboniger]